MVVWESRDCLGERDMYQGFKNHEEGFLHVSKRKDIPDKGTQQRSRWAGLLNIKVGELLREARMLACMIIATDWDFRPWADK